MAINRIFTIKEGGLKLHLIYSEAFLLSVHHPCHLPSLTVLCVSAQSSVPAWPRTQSLSHDQGSRSAVDRHQYQGKAGQ